LHGDIGLPKDDLTHLAAKMGKGICREKAQKTQKKGINYA
jgi:hypothetical protein